MRDKLLGPTETLEVAIACPSLAFAWTQPEGSIQYQPHPATVQGTWLSCALSHNRSHNIEGNHMYIPNRSTPARHHVQFLLPASCEWQPASDECFGRRHCSSRGWCFLNSCGEEEAEGGVEEVHAEGTGLVQLRFQRVAPLQQFLHPRHDALLSGQTWKPHRHVGDTIRCYVIIRTAPCAARRDPPARAPSWLPPSGRRGAARMDRGGHGLSRSCS